MFVVDEVTAAATRRAYHEGGELSGIVELRGYFPLITSNASARLCVRSIVGWAPRSAPEDPCTGQFTVALIGFRGGEFRAGQLGWEHLVRKQKRE